jgi:CubicO group peptidase (beta-lactamase class C family)
VFESAHAQGDFNGSVLITRGTEELYRASFGLADEQRRLANTGATRFMAYSISKPMTAVLVFQQIAAGKLQLGQRLEASHESLRGTPVGAITIGQLLSHTSGIDDVIGAHRDRRITFADLEDARVRDAGKVNYSSAGFVILALVLESVTGLTYRDLIQQHIFDPAGMKDSGLLRTGASVEGLALGHSMTKGKRQPAPLRVAPEALEGAGSLYTTTADLARFDKALSSGALLSQEMQRQMYTRVTDEKAYGWSLGEQGGRYFPWHQGSYTGFTAVFVRQIHRREMIAILCNDQDVDVLALRTQVLRLLKRDAAGN